MCIYSPRVSTTMISSLHMRWQVWLSANFPVLKRVHSMHSLEKNVNYHPLTGIHYKASMISMFLWTGFKIQFNNKQATYLCIGRYGRFPSKGPHQAIGGQVKEKASWSKSHLRNDNCVHIALGNMWWSRRVKAPFSLV